MMRREVTLDIPRAEVRLLQRRLQPHVEPQPPGFQLRRPITGPQPVYYGACSFKGFQLRRRLNYRNSFCPTAQAEFRPGHEGTTVNLDVSAPRFVVFFVVAILGILAMSAAVAGVIVFSLVDALAGVLVVLGAVAVPLLFGAIFFFSWRFEANRAERELTDILSRSVAATGYGTERAVRDG